MADPSSKAGDDPFSEEGEDGGGESTVSMASPTLDPSIPLPISVAPPPPHGALPQMQIPTAPVPFTPHGANAAMPVQARPMPGGPSVPTPFGGLTPGSPAVGAKPLPAAGAAPIAASPVPGAGGMGPGGIPGMKRPQTVIGLAPPPVGAPRPGSPAGARMPLPSGRAGASPRPAVHAPTPAATAPSSDRIPPSSGRGVRAPARPPPVPPASSSGRAAANSANTDGDSTDQHSAMPDLETPDSQKEDQPTMAKSLGESLALFGLDSGLTDAARAAVVPKPGGTPPQPPVAPVISRPGGQMAAVRPPTPNAPAVRPPPPPVPIPPPPANVGGELPELHDRSEEEESTRAVSREEMMRGHDAVIIGDDSEAAAGEDATLAVAPGMNDANSKHLAALAEALTKEQQAGFGHHDPPPPSNPQPFDPGFPPGLNAPYPQGPYPQAQAQQGGYPHAQQGYPPQQQAYAQSVTPQQQPWGQDPYQQQQPWQQSQVYPGSVGPVSGPHLPASPPHSQPHFPGANPQTPQSNPHLQVPQSGQMMAHPSQPMAMPGQPIPYPGQPMMHPQQSSNPFGDWNAGTATRGAKKPFKISGQILLLGIVGVVCLAIFITGIVLFATTKF